MPDTPRPPFPVPALAPVFLRFLGLCAAAMLVSAGGLPAMAAPAAPAAAAAPPVTPAARHAAARQAAWRQDFAWARALWQAMADAGDTAAMVELGHMARRGEGQPVDVAAARRLYQAALARGNPDGEAGLGRIAESGLAGPADPAEALRLFRQSAARGSPWGRYYLGLRLREGDAVPRDLPQSLRLLREAAAKGLVHAEHEVAIAQRDGLGTAVDLPAFVATMKRLAELGNPESQREWGHALARGQGVERQPALAVAWLQKAAQGADTEARNALAFVYYNGELGVKPDPVRAAQFARQAAEDDAAQAQWLLAQMYAKGEGGLPVDLAQVMKWLPRSSDNGELRATWALARIHTEGLLGQRPDCKAARPYVSHMAAMGHDDAERLLDDLDHGACERMAQWSEVWRSFAREWRWPGPMGGPEPDRLKPEAEKALHAQRRGVLAGLVAQGSAAARCALVRTDIAAGEGAVAQPADSLAELRQGAQAGALQCMELMYWYGRQDLFDGLLTAEEGAQWARRAAERGFTHALAQMGTFHAEGWGVPQDYQMALLWRMLESLRKQAESPSLPGVLARLTPRQDSQVATRVTAFREKHPAWAQTPPSWPLPTSGPSPVAALAEPFPLFEPGPPAPRAPVAPATAAEAAKRDAPQLRLASDGHVAAISALATDAQGRWLVTASEDKTLAVWRLPGGQREAVLRVPVGPDGEGRLRAVALSPDGRWVAAAGDTGAAWPEAGHAVYLLERESGRIVRRLSGLSAPVVQLLFLDEGRLLAAATEGPAGELSLFRSDDGRLVAREGVCDGAVRALQALPAGRLLAACADALLQTWRVTPSAAQPLQRAERARAPGGAVLSTVRLSPDGSALAVSFCSSATVNLLDPVTLRRVHELQDSTHFGGTQESRCEHLGHLPDGQALVRAGSLRERLVWRFDVWDAKGQGRRRELPLGNEPVTALLSVPGQGLAYATQGGGWGLMSSVAAGARPALQRPRGTLSLRTNRYYGPIREAGQAHVNGRFDPDSADEDNISDLRADGTRSLPLRDRSTDLQNSLGLSPDGEVVAFSVRRPDGRHIRMAFDAVAQRLANDRLRDTAVPPFDLPWANTFRDAYGLPRVLEVHKQRVGMEGETPQALAQAADGGSVLIGTEHHLVRYGRDGNTQWTTPVPFAVQDLAAARDGRWLVAALADGSIRWYAAANGRELAALFVHPDLKRWVLWTPEGPYVASPGAESLFGWHLNQGPAREPRFVGSERLYDVFYRPDIVGARLRGEPVEGLATTTVAQALAKPAPRVSLAAPKAGPGDEQARLCWRVSSEGGGIGDVRLFHNGKLIRSRGQYRESVPGVRTLAGQGGQALHRQLRSLGTAAPATAAAVTPQADTAAPVDDCADVPLLPGENTLAVAAFNADNSVQSPLVQQVVVSRRVAPKPRLFVLAIGINEFAEPSAQLQFAAKDARDIHALLHKAGVSTGRFESVQATLLTDRQADKPGIERALGELAQQVRPWDSVVLFVASHGVMDGQRYHLVTAGFDGQLKPETLIDSRELIEWSKRIPALHQLMILDTCHAGGVDWIVKGLYDARLSVLARQMGLHIFASASDRQLALDGFEGNGLFTHTLLGVAAKGQVSGVNEWGLAARSDTSRIAARLKHAQTPLIISFGRDFPLLKAP